MCFPLPKYDSDGFPGYASLSGQFCEEEILCLEWMPVFVHSYRRRFAADAGRAQVGPAVIAGVLLVRAGFLKSENK